MAGSHTAPSTELGPALLLAERAALAAGVTLRELHDLDSMREARDLLHRVWRPAPDNPVMTPELLLVLAHSGSYVVAVEQDGRMIGTCLGLLSAAGLHSHIAAVDVGAVGRSIGFALKLHQRAWSLARGISTITWTYDPLVSRNAYFNLRKLGAVPTEYLPNFYGAMRDGVNAGTDSDRLLVRWDLTAGQAPRPTPGSGRTGEPPVVALDIGPDGRPVRGGRPGDLSGRTVLVRVPPDIEALRAGDRAVAGAWRPAVRDVLGGLMADGRHTVTTFTRDGWYVLSPRLEFDA
ncbi:GNAT family N-acetyltransferase [Streptomyces hydrogenans]|uniref:GNAT family N-acetyltransferase n=1 Tax=Streptomyces hydrogenans TaxID=1873719 RepID=UPI00278C1E9F|nr:GNAT family N-acetyltransferase [Streptomyces hydrogenans]